MEITTPNPFQNLIEKGANSNPAEVIRWLNDFFELHGLSVHHLLAEFRQIASIWSIDDVLEVRPDLTEEQAWEVLQAVKRQEDANSGISWFTLEFVADGLFDKQDSKGGNES